MTSIPPPGYEGPGASWSWQASSKQPTRGGKRPTRGSGPRGNSSPDDPSQRLLRIAGALSVLLVLLVAFAWWWDSDENSLNPIAEAAERTQAAAGSRSTIRAIYTSAKSSRTFEMTGHGLYNGQSNRDWARMTMPGLLGDIEAVGDERTIYLRSDQISAPLPEGKEWIGIDPWLGGTDKTSYVSNGSAKGQLEMLEATTGDVDAVGEESVRGVGTTRYRGTVDLRHYAGVLRREGDASAAWQYEQLAKQLPGTTDVEAWIDGDGLMRRMRMVMPIPVAGGVPISMDMRVDYFDFGISPSIDLPREQEVFDATPLARAELNLLSGESLGYSTPLAGSQPLSAGAFHERATAICKGLFRRFDEMEREAKPEMEELERLGREKGSAEEVLAAYRAASAVYFEPAIDVMERGLRRLGRLSPPENLATDYRQFLRLSAKGGEYTLAQIRAIQIGEWETISELDERTEGLSKQSDVMAKRVGLDACVEKDE